MTRWVVADRHGVLHTVARWPSPPAHGLPQGLTHCAFPFTHGQSYLAPWPSSGVVEKMTVSDDDFPTCVHCVVKT